MDLSIVIPIWNGEENIKRVYERLIEVLERLPLGDYELLYIDDGSTDRTLSLLKGLRENDKRVKIIKFAKNFGQHAALSAGFKQAKGEIVVTMDNDLECDLTDIPKFLEKIKEGYDLVSGWRQDREASPFRGVSSYLFNKAFSLFSGVSLHDCGCPLKVWKRGLAKEVAKSGDIPHFISSLRDYSVAEVKVRSYPVKGSTYTLRRLLGLAFIVLRSLIKPPSKDERGEGYVIDSTLM